MNQLKTIIKEEVSIAKEGGDFTISYRETPNDPPNPPVINLSELLRAIEFLETDECIESFRGISYHLSGGPFDQTLLKKKFVFGAFPELVRWKRPELVYDEYENEIESERRQREEILLRQQEDSELQHLGKLFSPEERNRIESQFLNRPVDRGRYPKNLRESFQPEVRQNIEKRKIIFDKIKSSCEIILKTNLKQLIDVMEQSIEYEKKKLEHFRKNIPKEKLQLVKDKISSFTQLKDDIEKVHISLSKHSKYGYGNANITIEYFCKKFLEGDPHIPYKHDDFVTVFKTSLGSAINYLNKIMSIFAQTNAKTFHFEGGDFDDYIIGNLIQTSEKSDSLPKKNISFSLTSSTRDRIIIEEILKFCNTIIDIGDEIDKKKSDKLRKEFWIFSNKKEFKHFDDHFKKYLDDEPFIDLKNDFDEKLKKIMSIYLNYDSWITDETNPNFIGVPEKRGFLKTNKSELIKDYYDTNIRSYFQRLKQSLEEMKKNLEYQEHDEMMRVVEEIKVSKKNKILNNFIL